MAAWPCNLKSIDLCGRAEPEMQPKVILGKVTSPAAYFVDLGMLPGRAFNSRADSASVRFHADQADCYPVIGILSITAEKRRVAVHVVDHDIGAAVVVEVAKRHPPAERRLGNSGPS